MGSKNGTKINKNALSENVFPIMSLSVADLIDTSCTLKTPTEHWVREADPIDNEIRLKWQHCC